jgi:hypothetical protein
MMGGPKRRAGADGSLTATKAFIAVGALASTLAGWTKLTLDNPVAPQTAPPPTDAGLDLAPLPTLISAPDFSTFVMPTAQAVQQPVALPTLRHVSAPAPSSGGGGGGGGHHSSASTHSSR